MSKNKVIRCTPGVRFVAERFVVVYYFAFYTVFFGDSRDHGGCKLTRMSKYTGITMANEFDMFSSVSVF